MENHDQKYENVLCYGKFSIFHNAGLTSKLALSCKLGSKGEFNNLTLSTNGIGDGAQFVHSVLVSRKLAIKPLCVNLTNDIT